jgi:LysM repeat protein
MKNIAQGLSLKKYKGNTHKDGGIMVNALGNKTKDVNKAVAEVEGGEYNFRYDSTNPMNNYIIPARKTLPEVNDMAKQADRFKGNNRIDYNTRTNLLNKSMKLNEMLRVQQEQQPMQMAAFGGKLKKYKPGGLLTDDTLMADVRMQRADRAVSTPGNELTNVPIQPTAPLLSGSQKFDLPTKVQSVNPKVNNLDVSKEMEQASSPVKQKKNNFKGALSAVSGAVSALGPIGQGVGAALQLAPYAIDLGKAMFDKTSVQDLQTQGSAMRLPNTTYAKNGGKLNVKPLPKFQDGGKSKEINPFDKVTPSIKVTGNIPLGRVDDMNSAFNRRNPSTIKGLVNSEKINLQELINNPFNITADPYNINPEDKKEKRKITSSLDLLNPKSDINRARSFYQTPSYIGDNKYEYPFNPVKDTKVTTTDNKDNAGKNKVNAGSGKGSTGGKSAPKTTTSTTPTSTNMLPSKGLMLPGASSIVQAAKARFDKDNLERAKEYDALVGNALSKFNAKGVTTPTTTGTTENTEVPQSESSRLFKAGKNKQKLSEALMYGMAALPSEQIKTITPDYGRGDDAMSRMGLSTEPIRQEMMQGANKALELSRSQVGTAGQLQSRGQSIMSNLSSQLSQSQIQQQQYLNQLRGALAQREDTKSNVLAQSELTAREAKSAERAAKLDQLNNAISQTSAIGAGTMEQASKMSTIENENERFKRNQDFIRELANQGVSFEVDENGKIVFNNKVGSSNIKPADLSNPNPLVVTPNPNTTTTTTTPKEHVVKQGEGFNAIAAKYKIPVDKLLKLNNLKIGDTIHPNQKLKIE